ncbi:hypothetical protein M9H77_22638 [Catharanthus roseus]|uniref:Uncharacterized protein n=1 Tax=Catharanthus roseus TaxID=4058 RepID=A0ACC0ASJ3_CATRO|nr:hypothetical protein M9H77_22638 [Catharanthus roseus]
MDYIFPGSVLIFELMGFTKNCLSMRILLFSWFLLIAAFFHIFQENNFILVSGQASPCLDDQRSFLLQFKGELKSEVPTKLLRWNQDQNCCIWDGVECDSSGHVIGLYLDNRTMVGGIDNSSSLFSLQYLKKLNLALNNFNFTQVPSGLSNLTNLEYLNLSNAGFTGQVPVGIGRMTRLVTLDLSTRFPGTRPIKLDSPNLGTLVENLKELRELYLDSVNISAHGSEWCNALSSLSNITMLSLSNCYLSGPIDSSLSKLRSLSELNLDNNNLSATVPSFFANFSNLIVLSLSYCNLEGHFSQEIFQIPTLRRLDLSNNLITGSLPRFPKNGSFRTIELSHTNFSGSLPDSIGNLLSLSNVDLSNCNFSGPIPSAMSNLTELVYLDFSSNNFNGSIPSFQMCRKLEFLDLSRNNLTGPISSHFEGLREITNINLAYNSLYGSIPPSIFALPLLQKILLSNNQFDGQVNEFSDSSASLLDTLDLSSNQLKGSIPKSIFELQRLNMLSLSSNYFNGTIQLEMVKGLPKLARLELSHNNLSIDVRSDVTVSTFPQHTILKLASCNLQQFPDLRSQSRMIYLDLSHNKIKGEIPKWIWEVGNGNLEYLNLSRNLLVDLQENYTIPSLLVLDLHSNQLQGKFPIPPASAIYVDHSSNHFNNSIPSDIGQSFHLVLDLSYNSLTGNIPECLFENMQALGVLNLGKNKLNGTVPDKFPVNCGLKTLDLSRNFIQGRLPRSLVNCSSLEVLNIGSNRINDTFPCMLKNLSSLRVLVLRANMFHENILCSEENQSWPNLQIIDIASNDFSGDLSPRCFLSWRGMITSDENGPNKRHLRFDFLTLSHFYYQDTVTVTIKSLELELQKILTVFTSIDLSSNKFKGRIPETVGDLKALYLLNLSHNIITGTIPRTIGNLKQLGSLDLSKNQLTGMIPGEFGNLTFLSFLNLSYNKLSGSIPAGRQLQTFTETSYLGNTGLCGFPLNTSCNSNGSEPNSFLLPNNKSSAAHWQFIFIFGLGVIVVPLMICRRWRNYYSWQLDKFS